jgi:hypothetical protein
MMDRNKEEKRQTLKDSLSGILDDDNLPIENGDLLPPLDVGDEGYIEPYNTSGNLTKAKVKATKVITSMLRLFVSDELLTKSDFIQAKMNLDVMSISQILVSLKQIEYAIDILLRDIGFGSQQPRVFEVFGQLQKTKIELIREYNLMLINFEESMKRHKQDLEFLGEGSKKYNVETDNTHRGNRELMKSIQDEIKNDDSDEDDFEIIDFEDDED